MSTVHCPISGSCLIKHYIAAPPLHYLHCRVQNIKAETCWCFVTIRRRPPTPSSHNNNSSYLYLLRLFSLLSSDLIISHSIGETSDQIRAILSSLQTKKLSGSLPTSQQEIWYLVWCCRWSLSPGLPSPPPLCARRQPRATSRPPCWTTSTNWSWSSPCWGWVEQVMMRYQHSTWLLPAGLDIGQFVKMKSVNPGHYFYG